MTETVLENPEIEKARKEQILSDFAPEILYRAMGGPMALQAAELRDRLREICGPMLQASQSMRIAVPYLEEMAGRMGLKSGEVRLHQDEAAQRAAVVLGAQAFTVGRDIYFAKGQGQLDTLAGRKLLAHELAHVAQQQGSPLEASVAGAAPAQALEAQAERMEQRLAGPKPMSFQDLVHIRNLTFVSGHPEQKQELQYRLLQTMLEKLIPRYLAEALAQDPELTHYLSAHAVELPSVRLSAKILRNGDLVQTAVQYARRLARLTVSQARAKMVAEQTANYARRKIEPVIQLKKSAYSFDYKEISKNLESVTVGKKNFKLKKKGKKIVKVNLPYNFYVVSIGTERLYFRDHVKSRHTITQSGLVSTSATATLGKYKTLHQKELETLMEEESMSESELNAIDKIAKNEGRFDSINTYDKGVVSWGIFQFAGISGLGTQLTEVLYGIKMNAPDVFNDKLKKYGIDVEPSNPKKPKSGKQILIYSGPSKILKRAEALKAIQNDIKLTAVLAFAGRDPAIQKEQIRWGYRINIKPVLKKRIYPGNKSKASTFGDYFITEKGQSVVFDRVNQMGEPGALSVIRSIIRQYADEEEDKDKGLRERKIMRLLYHRFDERKTDIQKTLYPGYQSRIKNIYGEEFLKDKKETDETDKCGDGNAEK